MGSITSRKRRDGSVGYTAQIRIWREGRTVYQESQTFERKQAAQAWLKKRETELAEPGALERAGRKGVLVREMIDQYLEEHERIRPLGETKRTALKAIGRSWLGDVADRDLTTQRFVEFAQWRMSPEGGDVMPSTIGNDLAHLSSVLSVAKAAWNYDIDPHAIGDARKVLKQLGANPRSKERKRRPTLQELDTLLRHFFDTLKWKPTAVHMPKVVAFAIFSARRQEEICSIRWEDLDVKGRQILVRDMKHPDQKDGNDVWAHLTDEALRIIESMPRECPEIFPFHAQTVSRIWTDTCKFYGIEDLHFHDLRHDGVSRLFEMDWDIPRVASVSGHRNWNSLRRYTHLRGRGDPYEGWEWLEKIIAAPVVLGARVQRKNGG
ncbi:tyrosine-type recombinase/integrase [Pseudomonas solani]|uniref:tyrosine-type recombinase/integrase n=1 Tax=Pseudomonas solani TaxID=2731552 RepID=UPI003D6A705B